METSEKKWIPVSIPRALFNNVKKLIGATGDPSVAEYVRFAIRERMKYDKKLLEELEKEGMIGLR
jgi:metal-responsive CopG/Arc/MetJ family transcriptional regulator